MDETQLVTAFLNMVYWIVPILILLSLLKSPGFKGMLGEALVRINARLRLPAATYQTVHNVTLPTPDGTTQIDHVIVSRFGIFVIETKHMKGWIFGREHQREWTQRIYRKSFKFQNPLRQNYKHVKALQALLPVSTEAIHSVVVFTGASTLKSSLPPSVTQGGGYIRHIKSFRQPVLSDTDVQSTLSTIRTGRLAASRQTHRAHVQRLQSRSDPNADRTCPRCGNAMVVRTTQRGVNAGNRFWGCATFPTCRAKQNLD
ncbi:NERD domain-containing protein [Salinisphaera sp.]|uniref:nuclease-related domain-containing protein n=1 Tax=Salinisphaera sp. TaxID=1914330 RepID=UPI003C7CD281